MSPNWCDKVREQKNRSSVCLYCRPDQTWPLSLHVPLKRSRFERNHSINVPQKPVCSLCDSMYWSMNVPWVPYIHTIEAHGKCRTKTTERCTPQFLIFACWQWCIPPNFDPCGEKQSLNDFALPEPILSAHVTMKLEAVWQHTCFTKRGQVSLWAFTPSSHSECLCKELYMWVSLSFPAVLARFYTQVSTVAADHCWLTCSQRGVQMCHEPLEAVIWNQVRWWPEPPQSILCTSVWSAFVFPSEIVQTEARSSCL